MSFHKPLIHDNDLHLVLADGDKLVPATIPLASGDDNIITIESDGLKVKAADALSAQAGNATTLGADGKLFTPEPEPVTPTSLISGANNNSLTLGADAKLFVPAPTSGDFLSNQAENSLGLSPIDSKIYFRKDRPKDLISSDADNHLKLGVDAKLYVPDMEMRPAEVISDCPANLIHLGGDGKLCATVEMQLSDLKPNALGIAADGGYRVDPADLVSARTPNALYIDDVGKLFVQPGEVDAREFISAAATNMLVWNGGLYVAPTDPADMISTGAGNTVTTGPDGGIYVAPTDLSGVPSNSRKINTTAPLTGGGDLSADRTLAISVASTTATGAIQIATQAEVTAGTVTNKAVTPSTLAAALSSASSAITARKINTTAPLTGGGDLTADRTLAISAASTTATGAVQLATQAEVTAGTNATKAVTPSTLATALTNAVASVTHPVAGAATATANGSPAGIVTLAATNNTTALNLAATPANVASQVSAATSGAAVSARKINTTAPLTGGGDLTADRTLAISVASITAIGAVQLATTAETTAGALATKAVTPAGVKEVADLKVNKAGDTMTGNLYVGESGTNRAMVATGGVVRGSNLQVYKTVLAADSHYCNINVQHTRPDGTTNGTKAIIQTFSEKSSAATGASDHPSVAIDAGGMLFAGSGESAITMRNMKVLGTVEVPTGLSALWDTGGWYDGTERTILSSDNQLYLISGCQPVANAMGAEFSTAGHFNPMSTEGQQLGVSGRRWDAYIRNLNISGDISGAYSQLKADTGWQKFPSGLILQWGAGSGTGNNVQITFPIAYPTACYGVYIQLDTGGARWEARTGYPYKTGSTISITGVNNETGSPRHLWFSIGY